MVMHTGRQPEHFSCWPFSALPQGRLPLRLNRRLRRSRSRSRRLPERKRIVFPVLGTVEFTNDFGAPRPQGRHEGNDILAPRHALALAAEAGKVRFYTGSARAGCMLYLDGDSGTTYLYIHLNNDLTEGNDNRGRCVARRRIPARPEERGSGRSPGSRSASSETRATRTAFIPTFTSSGTRTAAGRRTRTGTSSKPAGSSSTRRRTRRSRWRFQRRSPRSRKGRCACA